MNWHFPQPLLVGHHDHATHETGNSDLYTKRSVTWCTHKSNQVQHFASLLNGRLDFPKGFNRLFCYLIHHSDRMSTGLNSSSDSEDDLVIVGESTSDGDACESGSSKRDGNDRGF